MFVKSMRFINRDGSRILQVKYAEFYVDGSGALCGETDPSDWVDVPLEEETADERLVSWNADREAGSVRPKEESK
jgi:hypothetical protein